MMTLRDPGASGDCWAEAESGRRAARKRSESARAARPPRCELLLRLEIVMAFVFMGLSGFLNSVVLRLEIIAKRKRLSENAENGNGEASNGNLKTGNEVSGGADLARFRLNIFPPYLRIRNRSWRLF